MMKIDKKKEFITFLKQNNAFGIYMAERRDWINLAITNHGEFMLRNMCVVAGHIPYAPFTFEEDGEIKGNGEIKNALARAFNWRHTKNGYSFWENLHFEWLKYLDRQFNIY